MPKRPPAGCLATANTTRKATPPPIARKAAAPAPAPAPAPARGSRRIVAQWSKTQDGPLGLKFEEDLSIGAMSPNAQSGQPQLENGMVLVSVNGSSVEGRSKTDAISAIKAAGRPLTLVFRAASAGSAAAPTPAKVDLPAGWEAWRPYQLKSELKKREITSTPDRDVCIQRLLRHVIEILP